MRAKTPPTLADLLRRKLLRNPKVKALTEGRIFVVPPELDRIPDVVLAYKPKPKTKATKRRKRKSQHDAKKG